MNRFLFFLSCAVFASMSHAARYNVSNQAEFDALQSATFQDGDVVYLQANTYDATDWIALTVTVGITVYGDGPNATIIDADQRRSRFLMFRDGSSQVRDLQLRGFTDAGLSARGKVGANEAGFVRLSVDNIAVKLSGAGIRADLNSFPGRIEHIQITNSLFENLQDMGISLFSKPIDGVHISGNRIRQVKAAGIRVGAEGYEPNPSDRSQKILVHANHISEVSEGLHGIKSVIKGVMAFGDSVSISDNIISDFVVKDLDTFGEEDDYNAIYTKALNTVISGNVISNVAPGNVIAVKGVSREDQGTGAGGYGALVSSNQIRIADASTGHFTGIKLYNDATIQGNHIEGVGNHGIWVQARARQDVSIQNNTVRMHPGAPGFGWGVAVYSNYAAYQYTQGQRLMITGNRVVDANVPFVHRELIDGVWYPRTTFPEDWVVDNNLSRVQIFVK